MMATPALRALRHAHPSAELCVEARPYLRDLLEPLPHVDRFLPDPGRGLSALGRRVRALRSGRFDWAVLLPNSPRSAVGPFLARIPRRVGYATDALRRTLATQPLAPPSDGGGQVAISMIERYLRVTDSLGCPRVGDWMEVPVTEASRSAVHRRVPGQSPLCLLIPGAAFGSSKLWPADRFAAAGDALAAEHGLTCVLAPGPGEQDVARAVADAMSCETVLLEDPVLTLAELTALCARSTLMVTNDTGPRQIAVAMGLPAVVLMGPTDHRYTHHHLGSQRVLQADVDCSPCGKKTCATDHRCMTGLAPEAVVAAARELLGGAAV